MTSAILQLGDAGVTISGAGADDSSGIGKRVFIDVTRTTGSASRNGITMVTTIGAAIPAATATTGTANIITLISTTILSLTEISVITAIGYAWTAAWADTADTLTLRRIAKMIGCTCTNRATFSSIKCLQRSTQIIFQSITVQVACSYIIQIYIINIAGEITCGTTAATGNNQNIVFMINIILQNATALQ